MKQIVVVVVNGAGQAMPLAEAETRLQCQYPLACTFTDCQCGPKDPVLNGKLRPSYEQQVNKAIAKK